MSHLDDPAGKGIIGLRKERKGTERKGMGKNDPIWEY